MKIVDIPVFNDDGSIKFTQQATPEEAKVLLEFALNFLLATGLHAKYMSAAEVANVEIDQENPPELND